MRARATSCSGNPAAQLDIVRIMTTNERHSSLKKRWGPPNREELLRERAANERRRQRRAKRKAKLAAMTPAEREAEERRREHRRLTLLLTRAFNKVVGLKEQERELLFERVRARKNQAQGVHASSRVAVKPELERNAAADVVERRRRKRKAELAHEEGRCAREESRGAVEQEQEHLCATAAESAAIEKEQEWRLRLDFVFGALASGARRQMLDALYEQNGQTVAELARAVGLRHQGATKHMAVLEGAGLVQVERRGGRRCRCFLRGAEMQDLRWGWLGKF